MKTGIFFSNCILKVNKRGGLFLLLFLLLLGTGFSASIAWAESKKLKPRPGASTTKVTNGMVSGGATRAVNGISPSKSSSATDDSSRTKSSNSKTSTSKSSSSIQSKSQTQVNPGKVAAKSSAGDASTKIPSETSKAKKKGQSLQMALKSAAASSSLKDQKVRSKNLAHYDLKKADSKRPESQKKNLNTEPQSNSRSSVSAVGTDSERPLLSGLGKANTASLISSFSHQLVPIGFTSKSRHQTVGTGFIISPQLVATLFENVGYAWSSQNQVWIEHQGQRIPVQIYSVDLSSNLALIRPQQNLTVDRPLERSWLSHLTEVPGSSCFVSLGYDESNKVRASFAGGSSRMSGGPCFDPQLKFLGLQGRGAGNSFPTQGALLAHLQNIAKAPASLPAWKIQVLAQHQLFQDQLMQSAFAQNSKGFARVGNYEIGIQKSDFDCLQAPTTVSATNYFHYSQLNCKRTGTAWTVGQKIGQIELKVETWVPRTSIPESFWKFEEIGLGRLHADFSAGASSFEGTKVSCNKGLFTSQKINEFDFHICSFPFEGSNELNSALVRWTRRDSREPLIMSLFVTGMTDLNLKLMINRMTANLGAAQ